MNSPSNDSPELTAYALGELSGSQAGDIHALLKACPAALSELEQIEAVTEALRQGAPLPQQRLTPDQRHAILHPVQMPRRVAAPPIRPRKVQQKPMVWTTARTLMKAAAVVAIAGYAFTLGRKVSEQDTQRTDLAAAPKAPVKAPSPSPATPAAPIPVAAPVLPAPKLIAQEKPAAPVAPATKPEKVAVVVVPAPQVAAAPVASAPKPQTAPQPSKPVDPSSGIAALGFSASPRAEAFVNASRRPSDQYELKPANIRPAPVKLNKADLFASPAPLKQAQESKENTKNRTPDLYIHSWKADVVSCPWNDANRLLRIVIQLPADQPAVGSADQYPLQITFDANHVREYRLLCERHQRAAEVRSAGTHVLWYEFQPNGTGEPAREQGKFIATVTLPGAHFTTQTVAPFDGSKLRITDRNQTWQNAREDLVFESSVVGFGMLLRGVPESDKLNHQLVLDLATKAKGADTSGERARFIRLVEDAKQAAGL